jgi:hypothetical protein
MPKLLRFAAFLILAGTLPKLHGQDPKADIQKKLASEFVLTKVTADRTDIVAAGSTLTLHKDGLLMWSVDTKFPPTSTYKDGKLSRGFLEKQADCLALSLAQPGVNCETVPQRKFVAGEKFRAVALAVEKGSVIIMVYSDPYADVRYYGQIKFPFQKHTIPNPDDLIKNIAEVVTAEPPDSVSNVAAETPPPPIAPPPPPPDTPPAPPKTITVGQTKDQVVAIFGQPQKVATVGSKEIDSYPDMKVTFVNGKVTDVD